MDQPPARRGAERGARALAAAPLRICGEGDSWLSFLGLEFLFPKTFFDILGDTFSTLSVGFPGHTFEQILAAKQFKQTLDSGRFKVFIFSGGGNDFLGGGALVKMLKNKSDGHGSSNPSDFIKPDKLAATLARLKKGYRSVAKQAKASRSDILMLTHGYDYAIPRKDGQWLGTPLKAAGFAHDDPLSPKIIAFLVDRFNDMLGEVDAEFAHVRHVNVRQTIKTKWHDELHPTTEGAKLVAKLFEKEIGKLLIS
jgi:lysophospholipase L1-like esterase